MEELFALGFAQPSDRELWFVCLDFDKKNGLRIILESKQLQKPFSRTILSVKLLGWICFTECYCFVFIQKSFKRKTSYEWSQYTHVVLKVRGDGRQYLVNLSTEGIYDLNWFNLYSYPLYTRGGPYWQITKVIKFYSTFEP